MILWQQPYRADTYGGHRPSLEVRTTNYFSLQSPRQRLSACRTALRWEKELVAILKDQPTERNVEHAISQYVIRSSLNFVNLLLTRLKLKAAQCICEHRVCRLALCA